jgi:transcriptional regulator with XRE-family HTH domain
VRTTARRRSNASIKAQIQTWLRAGGHTQRWLAQQLGVTPTYVSMILNARRTPSLGIAKQLEDLTGIPAIAFLPSRAA